MRWHWTGYILFRLLGRLYWVRLGKAAPIPEKQALRQSAIALHTALH
ncbi:hypothetical protein [Nostoc commune]|nr:hypothetical protein [Nostoc commune]